MLWPSSVQSFSVSNGDISLSFKTIEPVSLTGIITGKIQSWMGMSQYYHMRWMCPQPSTLTIHYDSQCLFNLALGVLMGQGWGGCFSCNLRAVLGPASLLPSLFSTVYSVGKMLSHCPLLHHQVAMGAHPGVPGDQNAATRWSLSLYSSLLPLVCL